MATNWTSVMESVPPLDIRGYQGRMWDDWLVQFKFFANVASFELIPNEKKVSILMWKLGPDAFTIFKTFNVDPEVVNYELLLKLFSQYFQPATTRQVFFNQQQMSDESFEQFAKRLNVLSCPCRFGALQDSIVRDVFIMNMNKKFVNIRQKILEMPDPSLQDAVTLATTLLNSLDFKISQLSLKERIFSRQPENSTTESSESDVGRFTDVRAFEKALVPTQDVFEIERGKRYEVKCLYKSESTCFVATPRQINVRKELFARLNEEMDLKAEPLNGLPVIGEKYAVKPEGTWTRVVVTSITKNSDFVGIRSIDSIWKIDKFQISLIFKLPSRFLHHKLGAEIRFLQSPRKFDLYSTATLLFVDEVNGVWNVTASSPQKFSSTSSRSSQCGDKPVKTPALIPHSIEKNAASSRRDSVVSLSSDSRPTNPPITPGVFEKVHVFHITDGQVAFVCLDRKISELRRMEDEMLNEEELEAVKLPRGGMVCQIKWDGRPQRVEILRTYQKDRKAMVLFVDRGNHANVDYSCVMFLKPKLRHTPYFVFPVRVPRDVKLNVKDQIEVKINSPDRAGVWEAEIKVPTRGGISVAPMNAERNETSKRNVDTENSVRKPHPLPIPPNKFSSVLVTYVGVEGIFVTPRAKLPEREKLLESMKQIKSCQKCKDPQVNSVYFTDTEGDNRHRVRVLFKKGNLCSVVFIDVGDTTEVPASKLFEIPSTFPKDLFTFGIRPEGSFPGLRAGDFVRVFPLKLEANGKLSVTVKGHDSTREEMKSNRVESKLNGLHEHSKCIEENGIQSSRGKGARKVAPWPIAANCFSAVRVAYIGEEGTFVTPLSKSKEFGDIFKTINKIANSCSPCGNPIANQIYLAPFGKELYRARVLSTRDSYSSVVFIDFGNQSDIPANELLELPDSFPKEVFTFRIRFDDEANLQEGDDLEVLPITCDPDGTLYVKYRQIPEDGPIRPKELPIPSGRYTAVRVAYVGDEGTFVTPVEKSKEFGEMLDSIRNVADSCSPCIEPVIGKSYFAPFENEMYRARVLSKSGTSCSVAFIDFGNKSEVSVCDLLEIPASFTAELFTFRIQVDGNRKVNFEESEVVKVSPVSQGPDGTVTVQLDSKPQPTDSGTEDDFIRFA